MGVGFPLIPELKNNCTNLNLLVSASLDSDVSFSIWVLSSFGDMVVVGSCIVAMWIGV
jgi:hypothetical protein